MKTFKIVIGSAEIGLAIVAVAIAMSSAHPSAWFGYVLAVTFGSKGLLLILSAGEG
jgi:hypothetical protein